MTATLSGFLAAKSREVRAARASVMDDRAYLASLHARARADAPAPSLERTLRAGSTIGVIAEFKRRSPSAGPLGSGESPTAVAADYLAAGATAISVLTDEPDFGGTLDDLAAVAATHHAPVLRKDFIVDDAGVLEARAVGAAAVLLIVAMLDAAELRALLATAESVGIDALVEVRDAAELEAALVAGATLVGVNNRDLERLETTLATTERLASLAPPGVTLVSESGIRSAADVMRVRDAGADAVLVGESLLRLRGSERADLLAALAGVRR